ncbi:MAG: DUF951 domain-containing protein [Anaerolineae bacterium]
MLIIRVDDVVQMRKPHPCGGTRWVVTRVGADIGIRCLTCGRRVMIPRSRFERRLKRVLGRLGEVGNA